MYLSVCACAAGTHSSGLRFQNLSGYAAFRAATDDRLISRELMWASFLRTAHTLVIGPRQLRTFYRPNAPYVLCVIDHPEVSLDISNANFELNVGGALRKHLRWQPAQARILDDGNLIHMLASDWMDADHPKLTVLPIGFPGRSIHANVVRGKLGYEALLNTLPQTFPPNEKRQMKILSTAHFATRKGKPLASGSKLNHTRLAMISALKNKAFVHFHGRRLSFADSLRLHSNFSFALCPEGNGMDTHRFYETLAAGVIPIVQRNSLSQPLYERHFKAVLVVDQWSDITVDLLARMRPRLAPLLTHAPLRMRYWINHVDAVLQRNGLASSFER